MQRFQRAYRPLGEARPEWQILADLADRMGRPFAYQYFTKHALSSQTLTPNGVRGKEPAGRRHTPASVSKIESDGWEKILTSSRQG